MINVVFFGSSTFGLPSLTRLSQDRRFRIVGVVSQPDRPRGRKQIMTPTPIADFAQKMGWELFRPESLRTSEAERTIASFQPDLFLVAAYGLIIPEAMLAIVRGRAVNIHASLLPKFRGASPIAAAIFSGETKTGVSLMVMTPRLDDGPTIGQWTVAITPTTTAPELTSELAKLAAEQVPDALAAYMSNQLRLVPQAEEIATYSPKLTRDSGRAVWANAAEEERRIRAYDPWPGCWTTWRGERLRILAASVEDDTLPHQPGTVIERHGSWGVSCRSGVLIPSRVQRAGGKPQPAEGLQSLPGFIGSTLGV